jgi:predicted ester cyclase
MSEGESKALLRRSSSDVWEEQNPETVRTFLSPDYQRRTAPEATPLTADDQVQRLIGFRIAFPDIQIEVEDVIAEGDRIAFRSTARGAHQGEMMGIAPPGRQVAVGLIGVMRVEKGTIVE